MGKGSDDMGEKHLRVGIKVAQMTGLYDDAKEAWLEADRLGFDTGWLHDHLLNQNDHTKPEEEGWTILAALLALSKNIRAACSSPRTRSATRASWRRCAPPSTGSLEGGLMSGWGPAGWRPSTNSTASPSRHYATVCAPWTKRAR